MAPGVKTALDRLSVVDGHNPTIDYVRLIAAVVIVNFHADGALRSLVEAAVGYFAIAMLWFMMMGCEHPRADFATTMRNRAKRLLVPFVSWNIIMLGAKAGQVMVTGGSFVAELQSWFPPAGSFAQLWFLPWAMLVCLCVSALFWKKKVELRKPLSIALAVGLSSLLIWLALWVKTNVGLPLILALFVLYLPSAIIGAMLFALRHDARLMIGYAVFLIGLGLWMQSLGLQGTHQLTIAAPVTCLALLVRLPTFPGSDKAGPLSMDIYLSHMLVIALISNLTGISPGTTLGSTLVIATCIVYGLVVAHVPFAKWLR